MIQFSVPVAKQKTEMLDELLGGVKSILKDYFISEKQMEAFEDFKHSVLGIADGELSFAEHTHSKFIDYLRNKKQEDSEKVKTGSYYSIIMNNAIYRTNPQNGSPEQSNG